MNKKDREDLDEDDENYAENLEKQIEQLERLGKIYLEERDSAFERVRELLLQRNDLEQELVKARERIEFLELALDSAKDRICDLVRDS